jgi:arginine-tRNA-protein transferase
MARNLRHFIEPPRACSYIKDEYAQLEIRIMLEVSQEELELMLIRGWRRFGPCYFRPACTACNDCVSIRLPTDRLLLSQSQKRAKKACARFRVEIGPPRVDRARLALYHKWHSFREERRGWDESSLSPDTYAMEFSFPHPAGRELSFYDDHPPGGGPPRLIGVSICDETKNAWSAVYFFYDPEYAKCSLGIYNVLYQVDLAREKGIPYVYLGYRVTRCESMQYKSAFRPHELLTERPGPNEEPRWFVGRDI